VEDCSICFSLIIRSTTMCKKLIFLSLLLAFGLTVSAQADIIINATESCRTDVLNPDTNNHNSSKLSIRSDEKSAKSWIKFDLGDLNVGNLETATLTVTLIEPKSGDRHFDVSCVNDDCLDNIGWDERSLTWNNAPGNNTADFGTLDTGKTTLLTTVNFTDGVPGDAFTIDVLEALEADTDGIVQFVCYNSNGLLQLATHDHAEETWRPFIDATEGIKGQAKKPYPADKEEDVPRDLVLSWKPGLFANTHNVYFGTVFSDVNDGIGGITQSAGSYAPGRLNFGTAYYWRVDEVNGPPDFTVHKGNVWRFTTEALSYIVENATATASSSSQDKGPENTVNGSGLDSSGLLHSNVGENNMWLSDVAGPQPTWIEFEFDTVCKLHEMWVWNSNESLELMVGLGFRDVTIEYSVDGISYTTLGTTYEFAQATGTSDYAHNTTVDLSGVAAKYIRLTANSNWGGFMPQFGLSEVRFFHIPVTAREPSPASGTTDVELDLILGWRAGRDAARHDVYLSSDEQAVIDGTAPVATVTETSYGPLSLDLAQTYYWRVDEVNDAETPATWQGGIWDFSTQEYLVVDDFEDYNDYPPDEIFSTWTDGWDTQTNGALIAHDQAPWAETTIVHSGRQSMSFRYDNNLKYSEAERPLDPPQDWTRHGVGALSLWFHGDTNNTAEQMYVKVNGSKVVYSGNADDITHASWQQWNIDLALFGVDPANVTKLAIGFGDETNLTPGGSGIVYFDDISLYPFREP